jgi:cell division protein FtsZ
MTIKLSMPISETQLKPRITVIGVGGAGGNAVNNMISSNLEGADFLVCNTDSQALEQSVAEHKIQLGVTLTQGLGAGARPEVGKGAAEEVLEDILDQIQGSNMVFVTAGMGGGTGTGAAPVIARAARENGMLTVGVVTKPFHFEGAQRMRIAEEGIEELSQFVDTLIIIPNQNLFRIANEKTTFAEAFNMADEVLNSGVRGVTDLMVMPGLINLDFADIRTVMSEMGKAMMGTGESDGENRAIEAAEAAISNPLLDDITMEGARGVLINITGGPDITLFEVDEAANRIRQEVDENANILFGSTFDESMAGKVRVSVVATGIDSNGATRPIFKPRVVADAVAKPVPSLNAPSLNQEKTVKLSKRQNQRPTKDPNPTCRMSYRHFHPRPAHRPASRLERWTRSKMASMKNGTRMLWRRKCLSWIVPMKWGYQPEPAWTFLYVRPSFRLSLLKSERHWIRTVTQTPITRPLIRTHATTLTSRARKSVQVYSSVSQTPSRAKTRTWRWLRRNHRRQFSKSRRP